MSTKQILFIAIIIIVIIAACIGIYYVASYLGLLHTNEMHTVTETQTKNTPSQPQKISKDQAEAELRASFPETITGTIHFLDNGNTIKTTITADDGTEYTLWPMQRESIYQSFGVSDGQRVEIWAKPSGAGSDSIAWGTIKPL